MEAFHGGHAEIYRRREQPDIAARVFGVNVAAKPREEGTHQHPH